MPETVKVPFTQSSQLYEVTEPVNDLGWPPSPP